jgi:L-alanine-DL-glutamate epimerase-like enolase superfamily enzyme
MRTLAYCGPVFLDAFLIIWTALVYKHSHYGDFWAIGPALAVLPAAIIWHVWLIFHANPKLPLVWYAAVHLPALTTLFFVCSMLISKDSL